MLDFRIELGSGLGGLLVGGVMLAIGQETIAAIAFLVSFGALFLFLFGYAQASVLHVLALILIVAVAYMTTVYYLCPSAYAGIESYISKQIGDFFGGIRDSTVRFFEGIWNGVTEFFEGIYNWLTRWWWTVASAFVAIFVLLNVASAWSRRDY